jgi:hypothetical protein
MIGYFPEPYPDELFYSLCARFSDRMKYPHKFTVVRELFGKDLVTATVDLPRYLGHLADVLPPGHSCKSVDRLIDDHTLLPFYGPFLPVDRLERVREDMIADEGVSPYIHTGSLSTPIRRPPWLRFCPACVASDRECFGECYWHRVHQLAGIDLCSVHEVSLENSAVRTPNFGTRNEFRTAESAIERTSVWATTPSPFHECLLALAQDAAWLLTQSNLAVGPELLCRRYKVALIDHGLASLAGCVKTSLLLESFNAHYSPEFLTALSCNLDERFRVPWLARFVQVPDGFRHPLRHLLLIHFLGHTVHTFLQLPTEHNPFGSGPWPCLNRASSHYGELRVQNCQVVYARAKRFRGTFACECGFAYSRKGPDRSPEDLFRIDTYKSFGPVWEEKLKMLWEDPKISLNRISVQLGIDRRMILRQAAELDLQFPPPGASILKNSRILSVPDHRTDPAVSSETRDEYREQWLSLLRDHPEAGRQYLQADWPELYRWLHRHDIDWLKEHLPSRKVVPNRGKSKSPSCVNWAERDEQLAGLVPTVVQHLLQVPGRPVRVSIAAIRRKIAQDYSLKARGENLPLTSAAMAELAESREAFTIRRIEWVTAHYRDEQACPTTRTEFMKRASIKKEFLYRWPSVRQAMEEALQNLRHEISDSESAGVGVP